MNNHWHKSSYSPNSGSDCVECRTEAGQVLVRDTQHRDLGHFAVPAAEWRAFLYAVRGNELD